MRVLVAGASGLIGTAVCARLDAAGHDVVRVVRDGRRVLPGTQAILLDMAGATSPEDWFAHLAGVDVVVNCAGVLQESAREDPRGVHATGAAAMFAACARSGIRRIIHFSAIGVDREQRSTFSATKLTGDEALMALPVDWVILRPSVVLGRGAFGASALMRGLAALPVLPVMPGAGRLQVVQMDDVIATVVFFLPSDRPSRLVLELAGPEALTMSEVVERYRRWLGWKPARQLVLPPWAGSVLYRAGDLASWFGWRPPIRTNAEKEIARGATGDPEPWARATGIRPLQLDEALAAKPPSVQERWFARLYFAKPAIFIVLPFFWIMTGIVSLTVGWRSGVELLLPTFVARFAEAAVVAGAIADIAVGALIAWRPTSRAGIWGAIGISLFYATAGTILRPDLWAEPLGPLMKILPILILHFVALAILEER